VQSFFIEGANSFCPQDPNSPNSIPTQEFCDFTFTARNLYNRASVNAQSSFVLAEFRGHRRLRVRSRERGPITPLGGHVRRNNKPAIWIFGIPASAGFSQFWARARKRTATLARVLCRAREHRCAAARPRILGETRLRAFYGEGIKEPRFDQLYSDTFGDIGNPNLKPEASKAWSVGLEQNLADARVKLTAEYFSNRFYNLIGFEFCVPDPTSATGNSCNVVVPGAPPFFGYFINVDRARARGVDFSVDSRAAAVAQAARQLYIDDSRVVSSPNALDPALVAGNHLITAAGEFRINCAACRMEENQRQFRWILSGQGAPIRTSGSRSDPYSRVRSI